MPLPKDQRCPPHDIRPAIFENFFSRGSPMVFMLNRGTTVGRRPITKTFPEGSNAFIRTSPAPRAPGYLHNLLSLAVQYIQSVGCDCVSSTKLLLRIFKVIFLSTFNAPNPLPGPGLESSASSRGLRGWAASVIFCTVLCRLSNCGFR